MSIRDATSATLTMVDLAGSEAATQNGSAAAVQQGIGINKSLHWLKVAVHELAAGKPAHYRNSVLTPPAVPLRRGVRRSGGQLVGEPSVDTERHARDVRGAHVRRGGGTAADVTQTANDGC